MTVPAAWRLASPSAVSVLSCDDPAESLARHAAYLGENVLHHIAIDIVDSPYFMSPIATFVLVRDARLAFRFAAAALVLHGRTTLLRELDTRLFAAIADL